MGLDQVNLEADVVVASKAPADKVPVAVTSASSTVDNKQEQALQEAPSVQDFIQEKTEEQQLEADLKANVKQTTMDFIKKDFANKGKRPKACFVTLVRNSELNGLLSSIRIVEQRFNAKFKYDWIFLNDEPFSEEFKKRVQEEVSSTVKFGLIPKEHWSYPDYIDQSKAADTRAKMADIIYGGSESYRHMCRYQSGFFWRHPLLDEYSWYWRVEPDTQLYCDINYDVFQWMQDHERCTVTITIHEYEATIPTLWKTSMNFFKEHPEYVSENNLMKFLSGNDGETYNLCHFWSNFEIASLDLWRSPAYRAYFDYLDRAGGFFYERWGDAPVHSIAAALRSQEIRSTTSPTLVPPTHLTTNCPRDMDVLQKQRTVPVTKGTTSHSKRMHAGQNITTLKA
ncbi:alpha-1,2-mannosyltransferase KRE2 KNAG_0A03960 [Huiozyma naganishii CBS 8797]|uniref:Glycosyltransferase family 15 protein n=1 Tax=Huiozyma naganishii (strain ATCC MYA-139 / BCRC 22969 / CBS 8797 / KCTC 17520 / NBRC 10181 / NCYC 3082 / Yp74L-3) TaxID=1071383 RepID=J7QZX2_HUIN7|nr:hypothetical protein KNAG_0A03960 [Kazachstania naganishii CBS 8797]CCK68075.1 hypothetical protein KNAG_0A03960 [Kazachstania naganishii CBS 8797]